MDPNAALGRIWEIIEKNNGGMDELRDLVGNLLAWLDSGGFPPKGYDGSRIISLRTWLAGVDAGLTLSEREQELSGTEELSAIDGIEPLMFDTRATDGMLSGE